MISYAYDLINRINPFGFFDMIYVLEGTSIKLATTAANELQKSLKLPDCAFTYLTSHGEVGKEYIKFLMSLINKVEGEENKKCMELSAKMFFKLYGNIFIDLESRAGI